MDSEGYGYIQSTDLKNVLELMKITMDDNEVFKIITEVDPDNSGQIQ